MVNEKRLIDANALISNYEAHRNLYIYAWGSFSQMPTIDKVSVDTIDTCISDVINAPTVDAVEVVRCKDCKYLYPGSDFVSKHCSLIGIPTDDDDYCSYGVNKNNDLSL